VIFEPGVLEVAHPERVERVALVVGPDVPGLPARPEGPVPPFDQAEVQVFASEARHAAMDWLVA
jgi:pimeloyl-ACP methyl ester carboxylesterase